MIGVKLKKVILVAGGFGARLSEYTDVVPKLMVPVSGKPILWHIMQCFTRSSRFRVSASTCGTIGGIGTTKSIVVNYATMAHYSGEIIRKSLFKLSIPYGCDDQHR